MKLYTEEQVRNAYIDGYYDCRVGEDSHHDSYQCPNPIELPSDEEIEKQSIGNATFAPSFVNGAKWMRDKVAKNQ